MLRLDFSVLTFCFISGFFFLFLIFILVFRQAAQSLAHSGQSICFFFFVEGFIN